MSDPINADAGNKASVPPLRDLGAGLVEITPWQRWRTVAAPFAAMLAYAVFASKGWWPAAVAAVMYLSFVTYGSTSHDLVHRTLGLPRRLNDALLIVIELLCLRSGTAYRLSHLHHHRHTLADDDVEAASAGSLWRTLAHAPMLQFRLWRWACRREPASRPLLLAEAVGCLALAVAAVAAWRWTLAPLVYVALVVAGSWAFPLITVYIPHDRAGVGPLGQTRLFRGVVLRVVALDHLYHLEHHLYPAVPHHHWKRLADALDPLFKREGVRARRLLA